MWSPLLSQWRYGGRGEMWHIFCCCLELVEMTQRSIWSVPYHQHMAFVLSNYINMGWMQTAGLRRILYDKWIGVNECKWQRWQSNWPQEKKRQTTQTITSTHPRVSTELMKYLVIWYRPVTRSCSFPHSKTCGGMELQMARSLHFLRSTF